MEKGNLDISKIHSEINQICNQRFLLCTVAVTVFGVVSSLLIPKDFTSIEINDVIRSCVGTIVLVVLLTILFIQSHLLRKLFRTFSAYLIVSGKSQWEKDWRTYRKQYGNLAGYDNIAYRWVFLGLGLLSGILPMVLMFSRGHGFEPSGWLHVTFFVILVYVGMVIGIGFGVWHQSEEKTEERWREVLTEKPTNK